MKRLLVSGFLGFGDTFYQRPIVRQIIKDNPDRKVTLFTAYPQFFRDMPELDFWYRPTVLRCAAEALQAVPKDQWAQVHKRTSPDMALSYNHKHFSAGLNVIQGLEESWALPEGDIDFSFAVPAEWTARIKRHLGKKTVIIKAPTTRAEWNCVSRNPKTGLLSKASKQLSQMGYKVIAVGYTKKHEEEAIEQVPAHLRLEKGQLSPEEYVALLGAADLVVGPQSNFIPVSAAVGTPCFTIYGGYVGEGLLYDDRIKGVEYGSVSPDPFCQCLRMEHNCNKEITDDRLRDALSEFVGSLGVERGERDRLLSRRPVSGGAESLRRSVLAEVPDLCDDGARGAPDLD